MSKLECICEDPNKDYLPPGYHRNLECPRYVMDLHCKYKGCGVFQWRTHFGYDIDDKWICDRHGEKVEEDVSTT